MFSRLLDLVSSQGKEGVLHPISIDFNPFVRTLSNVLVYTNGRRLRQAQRNGNGL